MKLNIIIQNIVSPILNSEKKYNPIVWQSLALILLGISLIRQIYFYIIEINYRYQLHENYSNIVITFLLGIGFTSLLFYLIYKRKKIGWTLLLLAAIVSLVKGLFVLLYYLGFIVDFQAKSYSLFRYTILQFIVSILFIRVLTSREFMNIYNISPEIKNKTIIYSLILAIVICIMFILK